MVRRAGGPRTRRHAVAAAIASTAATALLVLSVVLAPAAAASGYTRDEPFWCVGYDVNTYPPHVWTNNSTPELVRWAPLLIKAVNGRWDVVQIGPWASGTFNNQGQAVQSWADAASGYGIQMRSFTYSQPGAYRVINVVQWSDLSWQTTWVPTSAPGYCTLPASLPAYGSHPAVDDPSAATGATRPAGAIVGGVLEFAHGLADLVSDALALKQVETALDSSEAPPAP